MVLHRLPPLLFKCCCDSLAQPLAIMFAQFLSVSYVPDDWKTAIIVLVYKKGPTTNVAPITDQFL